MAMEVLDAMEKSLRSMNQLLDKEGPDDSTVAGSEPASWSRRTTPEQNSQSGAPPAGWSRRTTPEQTSQNVAHTSVEAKSAKSRQRSDGAGSRADRSSDEDKTSEAGSQPAKVDIEERFPTLILPPQNGSPDQSASESGSARPSTVLVEQDSGNQAPEEAEPQEATTALVTSDT